MLADILELRYDSRLAEYDSKLAEYDSKLAEYDSKLAEAKARHEARHREGLMAEKRAIARSMKADGVSFEKISEYTGLTIKKINNL